MAKFNSNNKFVRCTMIIWNFIQRFPKIKFKMMNGYCFNFKTSLNHIWKMITLISPSRIFYPKAGI